ncbi:MAG: methyltransferase domain-containing protein [Candidatus Heimdallarchaeota archaeon]|nr:methyltransferase domain-containing protein [Candidatus Heimdallarchaeota archaeon]
MSGIENPDYYSKKLFAHKLKKAYEIASPRINQHLEAEIQYVYDRIQPSDTVLELGCGYGRVLKRLADKVNKIIGIDIAEASLKYAEEYLIDKSNIELHFMTARSIKFNDETFDAVIGIQNAISALKIDPKLLLMESMRITKEGGKVFLSSYSDKIWEERLSWFIKQSEEGLLGEIDYERTKNGNIVCKNGFKSSTFSVEDFKQLVKELKLDAVIEEVDESSIFCVITVHHEKN